MINSGRFKKGICPWNKGTGKKISFICMGCGKSKEVPVNYPSKKKYCSNECRKGSIPWNKGLKGVTIPPSRKGCVPWNKGRTFPQIKGEKNINWRGGITPEAEKIRKSLDYKDWRKRVIERDNYTCICCKTIQTRKNPMVVDHIKPFSLYPELRFEISNGRTFCKQCDWKYGFRWNRHISAEENKALVSK